ncbi:MAG TPA: hypothetical protein VJB87_01450 [Candidatus Nanoarchaeia archaeon]|nr:hypothetical protein [Candidatus Nanoarchaeia archaeon]
MGIFGKKKEERLVPELKTPEQQLHPLLTPPILDLAKEFSLLNTKLDLINARLENLHQRLASLEKTTYDQQRKQW